MTTARNSYAVIGGTLTGNRGAEAMVVTTIGRVRDRDPDASFLIYSYMADRDRRLVQDSHVSVVDASPAHTVFHFAFSLLAGLGRALSVQVPDRILPPAVRSLRSCRAVFDVSGISFHDGRLAVLIYNVLCIWPALLLGVPVVRLSQAMGPFENPLNRWLARWTTNRCLQTYSRGRHTSDFMGRLGASPSKWREAADVAFSYEERFSLTAENQDRVDAVLAELRNAREAGREIIAVVPSSLILKKTENSETDYVGLLITLLRHMQDQGHHVILLPNATQQDADTLRNNDISVIARIRDRIGSTPGVRDAITFVDFDLNTASIRALIRETHAVITSRFHAMVAALALAVPPLVIGWSHKYEEVLAEFDCADASMDFTEVDANVRTDLDRFLADQETQRKRITEALPRILESSRSQFDVLDDL